MEITFGEKLKTLRRGKGLSIRELAKRSNVSNAYLSQLENGKTKNPSYEIIGKIAKGLNISSKELLNMSDSVFTESLDGNDLSYTSIKEMDDKQRLDFGELFKSNRKYHNLDLADISSKTGIPLNELDLLEQGKLNRNLTELESINLLENFKGFEFSIINGHNKFNELLQKMPFKLTKEFMKMPGHEITFDLPSYEEVTINSAKFTSYVPPEKAIETFFEIENLLYLNLEALNFRGKKISKEQIEKIINLLTEDFK